MRRTLPTDRIIFLSDGVFAIAMTLLIVDIHLRHVLHPLDPDLREMLWRLGTGFLSLTLSFVALGVAWLAHHHILNWIVGVDRVFLVLNLAFLLMVTLVPIGTTVLANQPGNAPAVAFYAAILFLVQAAIGVMWRYAVNAKLVEAEAAPFVRRTTEVLYLTAFAYMLAMPVAWLSTHVAISLCAVTPLLFAHPRYTFYGNESIAMMTAVGAPDGLAESHRT